MFDYPMPIVLSLVTFLLVAGAAVFVLMRARKSQAKRGETPGGIAGPTDTP